MQNPFRYMFLGLTFGSIILVLLVSQIALPFDQVSASSQAASTEKSINTAPIAAETFRCTLPHAYPTAIQNWCQLIQESSATYSLDPKLVAAVMLQESGGDANAYSKSGAVGLMQVMPRDGLAAEFMCINGPCFANRPSMDELFEPNFNVDYGSRMLTNLIAQHGNWRDALKAYGPKDVGYYYADIVLSIYNNYQ